MAKPSFAHSIIIPALVAAVVSTGVTVGGLSLSDTMPALSGQVSGDTSAAGKQGNWVTEKYKIDKMKKELKKKMDVLQANVQQIEKNIKQLQSQGADSTMLEGLQGRLAKQKLALAELQRRYDALSSPTKGKK